MRALTSTYYGQLLIVKMILVAGVACVGAYNHYRLVPTIEQQPSKKQAWSRLRTTSARPRSSASSRCSP